MSELQESETRLRDRVKLLEARIAQLESDNALIVKGLKRASTEIEAEWGEEILPEGTEIRGVKF